ncbi:hypothetical protein EJ03DRAFT_327948 [Teratosphaeria nubilosa]|uniref:Uncharacterized protein n=1 Tax=Teratosphaeria nubilosa TaxID=161662 RepID=A0A6G1L894_9PEZI|nr:hypothetical protein EJ03DRAFT_327948 [Teratosphaeria nubilosa]
MPHHRSAPSSTVGLAPAQILRILGMASSDQRRPSRCPAPSSLTRATRRPRGILSWTFTGYALGVWDVRATSEDDFCHYAPAASRST